MSHELSTKLKMWRDQFRHELLVNVMPFWLEHSLDPECGGYFNCLDRDGRLYDTKKYVWLQGRQVWMFARLFNALEPRSEWLEAMRMGLSFLRAHAHRSDHRVYFCLTREGQPVQLQRKIFSECFYCMALAEAARALQDPWLGQEAVEVFRTVWNWAQDLSLIGRPKFAGSLATSDLALPMTLLHVMGQLPGEWSQEVAICVDRIRNHVRTDLSLVLETVGLDGSLIEAPEGRLVNPGHGIEAGWFLIEYAERAGDLKLVDQALDMIRWSLDLGWDPQYGGLFYFLDCQGYSPLQLEWDRKLWWPHCEALIATIWAYCITQERGWLERFEQVAEYTFGHFSDPEYGEWFGYLDRQGEVSQRFKGGPYKGCFHVPRALFLGMRLLERALGLVAGRGS